MNKSQLKAKQRRKAERDAISKSPMALTAIAKGMSKKGYKLNQWLINMTKGRKK